MKTNIIACTEQKWFRKTVPLTLRTAGVERVLDRTIRGWTSCDGTYGMGGPGFFSLELEKHKAYRKERLCLCLWGATEWLLIDGNWFASPPNQYDQQTPQFSNYAGESWDYISDRIVGEKIEKFELNRNSFKLILGNSVCIELPEDTTKLSVHGGSMEQRIWCESEDVLDAWVLVTGDLWTL